MCEVLKISHIHVLLSYYASELSSRHPCFSSAYYSLIWVTHNLKNLVSYILRCCVWMFLWMFRWLHRNVTNRGFLVLYKDWNATIECYAAFSVKKKHKILCMRRPTIHQKITAQEWFPQMWKFSKSWWWLLTSNKKWVNQIIL